MRNRHMLWITIIVLAVVEVFGIFFARKYEASEKVDKGIELCYWKYKKWKMKSYIKKGN